VEKQIRETRCNCKKVLFFYFLIKEELREEKLKKFLSAYHLFQYPEILSTM